MALEIAGTVYSLTVTIIDFIGEHEDKEAVTEQISNIAVQIQHIIQPLRLYDLEGESSHINAISSVTQVLESLHRLLGQVEEHLRSWKERRSKKLLAFVNPWAVTQQLKDDREQLMHQYIMLMGAMQIVDFIRGYNLIQPSASTSSTLEVPVASGSIQAGSPLKRSISDSGAKGKSGESEVERFWFQHIGSDIEIIDSTTLCDRIATWLELVLQRQLGKVARRRLLLRLDETNSGKVTLSALSTLVKDKKLVDVIKLYTSDPSLPLLVWIDDDVNGNAKKVQYALKCGVTVVQLSSTASAKSWIDINRDFLKKHDSDGSIRYISDQVRVELLPPKPGTPHPTQTTKNWSAGTEIATYIRETEHLRAPLLIYTGMKSLHVTRYVDKWPNTGSLSGDYSKYQKFVEALGKRRKDDVGWAKFGGGEKA